MMTKKNDQNRNEIQQVLLISIKLGNQSKIDCLIIRVIADHTSESFRLICP